MRSLSSSVLFVIALSACTTSEADLARLAEADPGALALLQPPIVPDQPTAAPLLQDWSNTTQITVNDVWSGVPATVGYFATVAASSPIDPQLQLLPLDTTIDVIANSTTPNTLTSGGIAEFDIADDVVAFQGSGTAETPNLVFTVDATGLEDIRVRYTLRDVDGSADNSVQPVALHYRVGPTGNYTNVPAAAVLDASTGPSLAVLVTPVDATLPAAANGASDLHIRVMTGDATGSDEWIGVDDIAITAVDPAEVAENAEVGTVVHTAVGFDPELGALTWAIVGGNTDGAFTIDASTGAITVVSALDFETTPSYSLVVEATDGGGLTGSGVVSIAVTDGLDDGDGDGFDDEADNCPGEANGDQEDTDLDGLGDACDACPVGDPGDIDEDGTCDGVDACPGDSTVDAELAHSWRGEGTATDEVGSADGAVAGAPGYGTGVSGDSFVFDSDDDRMTVPHSSALDLQATGFTAEFWVQGGAQPTATFAVLDKSHTFGGGTDGWAFQGTSASGEIRFALGTGAGFAEPASAVSVLDGAWHHVAGVWDGEAALLYVDGALQASVPASSAENNTGSLGVGYWFAGGRPFRGSVDEIGLYDSALDPAEILALYEAGDTDLDGDSFTPCVDEDDDGDGNADAADVCPIGDDGIDGDGDGTADACDACPLDNSNDTDGDGICNSDDACAGGAADGDGDGVADDCDVCPDDNPNDTDGDGVCDSLDACLGDDTVDTDGDGAPDDCDDCPDDDPDDSDGDAVCDSEDDCVGDDRIDGDGDGSPDACDACPDD
nr:cadherin domain-containing protein [Deltaproteobacteria bacterium]